MAKQTTSTPKTKECWYCVQNMEPGKDYCRHGKRFQPAIENPCSNCPTRQATEGDLCWECSYQQRQAEKRAREERTTVSTENYVGVEVTVTTTENLKTGRTSSWVSATCANPVKHTNVFTGGNVIGFGTDLDDYLKYEGMCPSCRGWNGSNTVTS